MKGSVLVPKTKWFIIFKVKYKIMFFESAFILPSTCLLFVVAFAE